jgi:N-acylneuraminate cytidylyltransferase
VNTDSPEIKNYYRDTDRIVVYSRPENLRGDDVSMNLIIEDTISEFPGELWLQTHVTNPLLTAQTIRSAIQTFQDRDLNSLMTVNRIQERLYDCQGLPINHDPSRLIPTQDLDPIYVENSCLYLFTRQSFLTTQTRLGVKPFLFPIDRLESIDIDYEPDFELANRLMNDTTERSALVTGSSNGIGRAIAIRLLNENWHVIGLDQEPCNIQNNRYTHRIVDLSDSDKLRELLSDLDQQPIDLLVNNAAYQSNYRVDQTPLSEWDKTINVNLTVPFVLSKTLFPNLKSRKNSSIVNIASVHSIQTSEQIGAYAASKGALAALTRAMSLEYIRDGIRVNAISPGAISTPMLERSIRDRFGHGDEYDRAMIEFLEKHPLKRPGMPEEIAETVMFLCRNQNIIGQNIVVDGGVTIRLSTE